MGRCVCVTHGGGPLTVTTLVVTNDFPPRVGGIESFVLAMVQRLPAGSVVVHTARQPGDAAFDAALPFPVIRDPSRILLPTPAVTRRVVGTARAYGADAVWFGAAAPLGLMAASLRRRAAVQRTVATSHGHEVWWATMPLTRQLLRRIGDTNDVVTYLGEYTRGRIASALTAEAAARMVQLPPGVDTELFSPEVDGWPVRETYDLRDRLVIVCVSRLVTRKGQDTLIRALPLVQRTVPRAALLLVGDGPARSRLERLAGAKGVADDVVFTGSRPWAQLPPYVAAGDVFAMPCRTRRLGLEVEGFGIVFVEAAASGLPAVAGRSGGAPDTLDDGRTGVVVDGRSTEEVADCLARLLLDTPLRRRLGEAGRRRADEFRWTEVASRLQGLLDGPSPAQL